VSGLAANVASFLATPSSANLAAALTDKTGTGANVFASNPTFPAQVNLTANSGYNIYASGTADNYLAGSLGIGGLPAAGFILSIAKNVTGAASSYGVYNSGQIQSDVTANYANFYSQLYTATSAFTLSNYYHYRTVQGPIGAGSAVSNQYGFTADSTLIGATNNYGFYGNIASGTGRYNLYMAGTADNYLAGALVCNSTIQSASTIQGNRLTIDNLANDANLEFKNSGIRKSYFRDFGSGLQIVEEAAQPIMLFTNATECMRIDSTGNVGIGTASPDANSRLTIGSTPVVTNSTAQLVNPTFASASTGLATGVYTILSTAAASFTVSTMVGFKAAQGTIAAPSAVTNQYGYLAESDLTGATNNVGFFGNIAAAAGRYNFYALGTAVNAFSGDVNIFGAGKLGYTTGSGGAVTQTGSRTTSVTLNKTNGAITLVSAAGSATYQAFYVFNSTISTNDVVVCSFQQASINNKYAVFTTVDSTGFTAIVSAVSGTATEAPILNFAVIKAVNA
jgi:hypothetical protein